MGGKELNAYITAGIENCHESYQLEEGRRKLQLGMSLMNRERSAARNLNALAPLINEFNSPQCMLCTDDRNPWEIAHEGHIDALIRRLIEQHDVPLHVAYRVASWSTARHFGLNHLGLLAPGEQADIVLLSDARKVTVQQVLVKGEPIDARNLTGGRVGETGTIRSAIWQHHCPPASFRQRHCPAIYARKTVLGH
ncbi:amidohydrolase family protein [Escherichia coli]